MTTQDKQTNTDDIHSKVRESYGQAVTSYDAKKRPSCCGADAEASPAAGATAQTEGCGCGAGDTADMDKVVQLYRSEDLSELPADVTDLSLGCGDPVTLASLQPGQTVLDLGSGGGIDCFLAAKRVGNAGYVIGVDMTAAMIDKARRNQAQVGATNVEFRLGEIENLPVANESVDVIISNCVINLSPDKPRVFREAHRVLKPGGRLAVSDIVTNGPLPEALQKSLEAWAGCVGGAMDINDYISALKEAGFVDIKYAKTFTDAETEALAQEAAKVAGVHVDKGKAKVVLQSPSGDKQEVVELEEDYQTLRDRIFSAKITAYKPTS